MSPSFKIPFINCVAIKFVVLIVPSTSSFSEGASVLTPTLPEDVNVKTSSVPNPSVEKAKFWFVLSLPTNHLLSLLSWNINFPSPDELFM